MSTPDPAAIAASLGKRQSQNVLHLDSCSYFVPEFYETMDDVLVLGCAKETTFPGCGADVRAFYITPLGRAVAAAIREQAP